MEPCLLDETSPAILDLVASLSGATHALGARLYPKSAAGLAELVQVMNCYYSNLIEGHNTTPREIERALQNRLDASEERRNLQIEARAYIRVQREVDWLDSAVAETYGWPATLTDAEIIAHLAALNHQRAAAKPTHNIACNTLPYVFVWMGLPAQTCRSRNPVDQKYRHRPIGSKPGADWKAM
jgi:Fic family protein